jgi:rhodanese-related sulfurtransferase
MKKINYLLLGFIFALFFVTTSCEKEETPEVIDESMVLAQYLESTDSPLHKDFVNTDMPTIIGATEVKTLNTTNQVYIIDIRSAADFATGHIANAHNVAFADLLSHIKGVNLATFTKVAIVCYTGQTAAYGASLLRLMGYDKVFSMKWGMCSWNEAFAGKWNSAVSNSYASQFVTTETAKGAKGDMPVLSTGKKTGQEILEARITALLTEGFTPASITNQTVFGNLTANYILNYWPGNHYAFGHIPGAVQYTPKETIKYAVDLTTLPANKTVVVYCYTGMTSGYLTAYLRLLGYDAKSLLYGVNGMSYDMMVANSLTTWKSSEIMGYEYVQ